MDFGNDSDMPGNEETAREMLKNLMIKHGLWDWFRLPHIQPNESEVSTWFPFSTNNELYAKNMGYRIDMYIIS